MDILRRLILAAVLAGALAGPAYAVIQQWRLVPLITAAEAYEDAGHHHDDHQVAPHHHDQSEPNQLVAEPQHQAWAPADGFERVGFTALATMLAGIGFALIFAAIALLTGLPLTQSTGVLWGLGGFLAFSLAPAFGLPPELPGMAGGELAARQLWWWATALCTGGALLGIAWFRAPWALALGLVVIALPQIVGAPSAPEQASAVPAHLASRFAASTLAAAMVFWLLTGTLLGWFSTYFRSHEAT